MTKKELYKLYITKNKTVKEISEETGLTVSVIKHMLSDFGIHREKKILPTEDELKMLYITNNMPRAEIAKKFNVSEATIKKLLIKYKITKSREDINKNVEKAFIEKYGATSVGGSAECREKYKEAIIKKYGVDNPMKLNEVKEKAKKTNLERYGHTCSAQGNEIQEKIKKTNLEKYGNEYAIASNIVKDKIKQTNLERYGIAVAGGFTTAKEKTLLTNLERYGVPHPMQSDIIKQRIKDRCFDKYGVYYPMSIDAFKDKVKETNLKKYGNVCSMHGPEIQEKIRQSNLEKYGVEFFCLVDKCVNTTKGKDSKPNLAFKALLDKNNIEYYDKEKALLNFRYDVELKNQKVLIEINPSATHNSTWGIHKSNGLDKSYHFNKTKAAATFGYHCIHVFDWDDQNKIISLIRPKKTIFARKCEIREVPEKECDTFLNTHHLQNTCTKQTIRLGLYYDDELVEIMTFGTPRYNKNYEYELLRLCTASGIVVTGGASKLFKYFLNTYNPKSILSYCDNSKFDGKIYKTLGFELKTYGQPTCHWYNMKTGKHITDNLLRQRGFDQLFKTNYGKGCNNEKLMTENDFVEVYDCGQSVWIYKN